jgi:cytoskeleton protein RodZ
MPQPPPPPTQLANLPADALPEAGDDAGRVYGMPNRDARIVIAAHSDSWVQVRDASISDVFTGMLRAGDSYRVPNREGLTLLTGNAGGLALTIDGEAAPPIGEPGEIARDVPLIPERLKSGFATAN